MNILSFLQNVDRRFLYALILFVVGVPFFLKLKLPVSVSPSTESLYQAIEQLQPNDFVLLSMDWGAGTRGENRPQSIILLNHIMRKKLRFAILSFEPQSKTIAQAMTEEIAKTYHYVYGQNWVNFGYRADQDNYLKGFVLDITHTIVSDINGTPIESMPVMKGVTSAHDIKLILDVTPSDSFNSYIKFVQGPFHVPEGVALTSVMAPEAYNRLDSKQLVGLMAGLQGAVEYETRMGILGRATRASISLSFAHFLIIALILMGNVAMVLERRRVRRMESDG